jgi:L-rhamnose-H+ transport protein
MTQGILLALLSGITNGLFSAPMKVIKIWKWENLWLVFIVTSCLVMPAALVLTTVPDWMSVLNRAAPGALGSALSFGFAWGFGAIFFGRSVERLGVSLSNSMVLGVSSALGSITPLILHRTLRFEARQVILFLGILTFLAGVWLCGAAGRKRDHGQAQEIPERRRLLGGYLFAMLAGVMSAVFNIGYSLALPIAAAGQQLGYSVFLATNCIWLVMLWAGAIPNIVYCAALLRKQSTGRLFLSPGCGAPWGLSVLMGLLWGGSIFLYGAAVPKLGSIGPSIGWPLSLAVALLVANLMGVLLGEWRNVDAGAVRLMRFGVFILVGAIVLCAASTTLGAS